MEQALVKILTATKIVADSLLTVQERIEGIELVSAIFNLLHSFNLTKF